MFLKKNLAIPITTWHIVKTVVTRIYKRFLGIQPRRKYEMFGRGNGVVEETNVQ